MAKGKPQVTTTTSEPPAWLRPYNQQAGQGAQNLYNQGNPFSPQTMQALQMGEQRALSGSPVTQAAQQYATGVLGGQGFMGNPYLDQTFNRAAMATQNQLASQFGNSGRNQGESQFLRSEQLGGLANSIYGGAYESERNRQQQLVPFAGQLANQDYQDIGMLGNIGQQYEQQPQQNLDDYIRRIQGLSGNYGTSTSSTPTQRNWLAGAASGAGLGSMFGPIGMLGGGILGGLYG